MVIEGYPFLDALFMTVITISTVGFGEVEPLSPGGKVFTTVLIIINLGGVTYAITAFSSYFIEGDFRQDYQQFRLLKAINRMQNHVIVCGYGRNGQQACITLSDHYIPYVVVESNVELEPSLRNRGVPYIIGNANQDDILFDAGIQKARALITTLPNDAENVFVVLTARSMCPNLLIVSRASNDSTEHKLRIAGADNIIMPDKVGGNQMATLISKPDIMEFVDIILGQSTLFPSLEEICFDELRPEYRNKTLRELDIRSHTGCNIVGFKHPKSGYIINPDAELTLDAQSKIIVLGTQEQIQHLRKFFILPKPAPKASS